MIHAIAFDFNQLKIDVFSSIAVYNLINKLQFLVLNMFLIFIQLLKPCIPSIATLLLEYILTFVSERATSKAIHIVPSSA